MAKKHEEFACAIDIHFIGRAAGSNMLVYL
eukprot:SAG11_NODE_1477_length_4837_cov_2.462431_1_plen_30_part_00